MALLAPLRVALIFAKLVVAQAFEGFTLPARLLKHCLLLLAQLLQAQEVALQDMALLAEGRLTKECKAQFGGGRARSQLQRLMGLHLSDAVVELVESTAGAGHLLVGGTQSQFLLVLDTLPEMKHRLQRKMEGHLFSWTFLAGQSQQFCYAFVERCLFPGFLHQETLQFGNQRQRLVERGIASLLIGSDANQILRGSVGGQ